jgi:hypothetical protein
VRVEWSRGWAYTAAGARTNAEVIGGRILAAVTQGVADDAGFRASVDMLDAMDPHRMFSTTLLDRLMPRSADLDGNGVVDGADLAGLLSQWGAQGGPADVSGDGVVGGADLGGC